MSVKEIQLAEVTPERHSSWHVAKDASVVFASMQHVVQVRAAEVVHAVCSFPLFLSRSAQSGQWLISAVTGLWPGQSLAVSDGIWRATFQPTSMLTYPFALMKSSGGPRPWAIGMNEANPVFREGDGYALYEKDGRPSAYFDRIAKQLEADIEFDIQTEQFLSYLVDNDYCKAVNINVHQDDGQVQTITGLHTLDEDRVQALTPEQLGELNERGYLAPMHAMLMSLFQLNTLVRLNNERDDNPTVQQIRLELARDPGVHA
ncbi:MAG: SapC family protein [Gammaproteobacteria bacterium]